MNQATPDSLPPGTVRSARFHLWRGRKDSIARWMIGVGGVSVIIAVVLIFFYLLMVVFPLFMPASAELEHLGQRQDWANEKPLYLSAEEQKEIGLRIAADGGIEFFRVSNSESISKTSITPGMDTRLSLVSEATQQTGLLAAATEDGRVFLFKQSYETVYSGGVETREIVPSITFPYGAEPLAALTGAPVKALALSDSDLGLSLALLDVNGRVLSWMASRQENMMTGEVTLDASEKQSDLGSEVTSVAISGNQKWLYVGTASGSIMQLDLPGLQSNDSVDLEGGAITTMTMLLGGTSVLAANESGAVYQLFPLRDEDNEYSLQKVREFHESDSGITSILIEQRRKGFLALNEQDVLSVYHSTSGRLILTEDLAELKPAILALTPRADALLIESGDGSLAQLHIANEHPEVSFSSLWQKVWYENYPEPAYIWQSSASTNEFESKFSLTPLIFGTLKAALYAMLFAIPLALMGAAYTAYFMAPSLRQWVKPGIEIMAALPTVILGFLAGLWLAPLLEEHLAGILAIFVIVPPGLLLFAWLWQRHESPLKALVPEGFEPVLQIPVLIGLSWFALWVALPLQHVTIGMDLRAWLSSEAGINYDQRNALVVGIAMGFAVIPTIFSIAEDAIFGVPKSLSNGSLALGATPWQSLVRVVIPTASPGIFSALMIGLGRAVGETMIVLMATGNTPIMDWNLFEGMRTLAANIAVEMPESEVHSSHYRILFLAALVLFMFTFVVNTIAEVIRQRLRERYSSL